MNDITERNDGEVVEYTDDDAIQYAANLPELEYQRQRKEVASYLGIGVTALDKVVRAHRKPGKIGKVGRDIGRTASRSAISWITRAILRSMFGGKMRW